MVDEEKFLGTIIISSDRHIDLFQVHIYENSIRFDPKFANGIASSENISKEIFEIDKLWKNKKINKNDIFPMMVRIIGRYEEHFSEYYFEKNELDGLGKYLGEDVGDWANYPVSYDERMRMYFSYLNGSGKLAKIAKSEFEKNIPDKESSKFYLEAFEKNGAKYFKYDTLNPERRPVTCFLMAKDGLIKFAFSK
jgi:hypothetical protein